MGMFFSPIFVLKPTLTPTRKLSLWLFFFLSFFKILSLPNSHKKSIEKIRSIMSTRNNNRQSDNAALLSFRTTGNDGKFVRERLVAEPNRFFNDPKCLKKPAEVTDKLRRAFARLCVYNRDSMKGGVARLIKEDEVREAVVAYFENNGTEEGVPPTDSLEPFAFNENDNGDELVSYSRLFFNCFYFTSSITNKTLEVGPNVQPPAAFPRRTASASVVSTVSNSTSATSASAPRRPNLAGIPDSALLIEAGYPGISYTMVDPSEQYQKYLMVNIQAPSGTDPLSPPNFNARLSGEGRTLELTVPVSPVFSTANLLTHRNATWMRNSHGSYENTRQTRLGGLGPAIAQVNTYLHGQPWTTVWHLPLSERCDEIVGNYAISNFPVRSNAAGHKFYPVVVEFKLKTVEQTVKREAKINAGVWADSDSDSDSLDELAFLSPPKKFKSSFGYLKPSAK